MIGLTELVIAAIAGQRASFPMIFGALIDDGDTVLIPDTVDIGLTVDTGAGLFVPVLRDPAGRPLSVLAKDLMALRRKGIDGSYSATELAGAHIVLALNNAEGITSAVPVVFPGTSVCVSLCTPTPVVELDEQGAARTVPHVQLGIAYDHRLINGREAAGFLNAVRSLLESPEPDLTPHTAQESH
jgi:2-oxoglutarate dehydrogenase E2 component (dihydrolipoamide succinyltransferase)